MNVKRAAALLTAVLLVAGCGGSHHADARPTAATRCDDAVLVAVKDGGDPRLGPDPTGGFVCALSNNEGAGATRLFKLSPGRAQTLVRIINSDQDKTSTSCVLSSAVLVLRYSERVRAAGKYKTQQTTSTDVVSGCGPATLSTGSGQIALSNNGSRALNGLNGFAHPGPSALMTPDDLGRSMISLADQVNRTGKDNFDQAATESDNIVEVEDKQARLGEVIWQSPLPGVPRANGVGINAIVAVRHEPACTGAQLTGAYGGRTQGTQDEFGTVQLGDTSTKPCTLEGHMTITGVSASGEPVTNSLAAPLPGVVLLPIRASQVFDRGAFTTTTEFFGAGDGPAESATNICAPERLVTPRAWVIRLSAGGSVRFPNQLPRGESQPKDGPYLSCGGGISFGGPIAQADQATTLNGAHN